MKENLSNVAAIRAFFREGEPGRDVSIEELKDLTHTEREELGKLCREALQESQI